ncbi:hypothetical protein E4631_06120 [Hymenobacter sp. UV11]|uniref:hypothetical protein n=1 Tax=Hymenobacter sp. UV11 TaxID=1849735 RepID=UPI00105BB2BE|nr:hypothetical protein [Hymenobacter sp. UV11]TDN38270.1 hypothetical protein A8B98_25015 [Hymenobacter sp. UV11]TFZ67553.1 hypothetical protein E4631_06120 [Hymenobacter sp. UV11]
MSETAFLKACKKCGIPQLLERFPFLKAEQKYRGTCKACRAAELRALRRHPDHAERMREAERVRSQRRRPAILQWQREHPDNMRPGRQRRAAARAARQAAAHAAQLLTTPPDNQPLS